MSKAVVFCTWDDVPHLTPEAKEALWASIPPHQRESRAKGIPAIGAGAIYPLPDADIMVSDFPIPDHWPRAYGLDVGWRWTAAMWGAWDREHGTLYLYAEYLRGEAEPAVHVAAIKQRGEWIRGVIDPASKGRSQVDGRKLIDEYRKAGLLLEEADNAVEAGLLSMWDGLSTGQIKVFTSCRNWLREKALYRRNEKGLIVKENDHLMDAGRYLNKSGLAQARTRPAPPKPKPEVWGVNRGGSGQNVGWMR